VKIEADGWRSAISRSATVGIVSILIIAAVIAYAAYTASSVKTPASSSSTPSTMSSSTMITVPATNITTTTTTTPPYVRNTLFLANNTLYAGNVLPEDGPLVGPIINPTDGSVYVGDGDAILVLNGASDVVSRTLRVEEAPTSLAFDQANGELYLGNFFSNNISVINPSSGSLVTNVTVAAQPSSADDYATYTSAAIVFDSSNGDLYVSVQGTRGMVSAGGWVSVISGSSNTIIANITKAELFGLAGPGKLTFGFAGPGGLTFDPSNGCIYSVDEVAAGGLAGSYRPNYGLLTVINGSTDKAAANIKVAADAQDVAYDSQNGNLYVVGESSVMSVVDDATNTVVSNVSIGSGPHAIAFDSRNGYLYVAGPNAVQVINPTPGVAVTNILGPINVADLVFDPANRLLFARSADSVYVIDGGTNALMATIGLSTSPWNAALDPSTDRLYAESTSSTPIFVIDASTNHVVSRTNATGAPYTVKLGFAGAAFDAVNHLYYVVDTTSDVVRVVNGTTGKTVATVSVEFTPTALVYDSRDNSVYVFSNTQQYQIINGSNNKVGDLLSGTVTMGNEWDGTAFDTLNGCIFVTGPGGIAVINGTSTYLITSSGGGYPLSLVFDPSNGLVYAVNAFQNTVTVIDGSTNKAIGILAVGIYPTHVAVDPSTGYAYVTNMQSGTVSIIAP
jgi:YVTN family beta-propeller protein